MTKPSSFEEVVEDLAWVDAMVEEYDSIVRNSAWEIVPRPEGKSVVGSRWIYKIWQRSDGLFVSQDWVGSPMDRKSTSRGIFNIRSTAVSWYSREQRSVALSSAQVEYMAASLAACEAIWMRKILVELFGSHIDIKYHHIRDCVQQRTMLHSYIPMEDQDADILTKALTKSKFEYHRGRIGVADNPYLVEREC
eukprot:PITA_02745